jgi:DNA-binding MarR family transcriptional regulator
MADIADAELVNRLRTAVGRISRALDRQVGAGEITRTQLSVLGTAARRGPIRLSDIAERENLNPTMLSRIVAKLDAAGYIRRLADPADQRAVLIEATDSGIDTLTRLRDSRSALISERLAALPGDTGAELLAALPALELLAAAMLRRPTEPSSAPVGAGIVR